MSQTIDESILRKIIREVLAENQNMDTPISFKDESTSSTPNTQPKTESEDRSQFHDQVPKKSWIGLNT